MQNTKWSRYHLQEMTLKCQGEIIQTFQDTVEDPSCGGMRVCNQFVLICGIFQVSSFKEADTKFLSGMTQLIDSVHSCGVPNDVQIGVHLRCIKNHINLRLSSRQRKTVILMTMERKTLHTS